MEHFDIVIKNATIITMNHERQVIQGGFICTKGDKIQALGKGDPPSGSHSTEIDARGGLLLPGLINCHTHASMTLFRGLADDLPLMEWLEQYIFPVESQMDGGFVKVGALLACAEMIMSGTTTFCDMYLFEDQVAEAAAEAGMRCLVGEVLYDFPSPNYGPLEKGFDYTEELINKWQGHPLVSIAVEPHSLFTCSPDLLKRAGELAEKYQVPLIIHVAETRAEIQEVQKRYGKGPVALLKDLGLLKPNLIADHCVHLSQNEMEELASARVRVAHNPESNMKLASGVAPVPEMINLGIPVGIGTDGCASNNNLDMLSEMDTAAKLHKLHKMDPTAIDALTTLEMGTIRAAQVQGMDHLVGSLEVGKKADFIIVDVDKPHLIPLYNPYSQVVYAASGHDVSHSVIDGRLVMKDRQLLTLELDDLIRAAGKEAEKVRAWTRSARKE